MLAAEAATSEVGVEMGASDAIEALSAARRDEVPVEAAMARVSELFHGQGAGITFRRGPKFVTQRWACLPARFAADYGAHYHAIDPWAREAHRFTEGRIGGSDALVARRELIETEFYRDLCVPHGMRDFCGAVLFREGPFLASFGLMRGSDARLVDERDLRALNPLVAPLIALARAELVRLRARLAESVAAVVPFAAFVLDVDRGELLAVNEPALGLLARGTVGFRSGRLLLDGEDITRAVRHHARLWSRTGIRVDVAKGADDERAVHLHVREPRFVAHQRAIRAAALYGLTPREAEVCEALLLGQAPPEIARRHRVAISTLRSQVRTILAKTGAKGLTGLLLLLAD